MMYEQAIVITRKISTAGQHDYFQVVLPKDVTHLIGIEYGFSLLPEPRPRETDDDPRLMAVPVSNEAFEVKWNYYLGNLTLMVPGCENVFFQEDVYMDKNFKLGEIVAPVIWPVTAMNFAAKHHEYTFRVAKSSQLLEGIYRDAYRNDPGNFFPYILRIYLWTEKCGL